MWYTILAMISVNEITQQLGRINLQQPTWDVFIVAFYVLAVLLYGLSLGKSRLVVNMVAIYIALVIASAISAVNSTGLFILDGRQMFTLQAVVFLLGFVGLYYLLAKRSPLSRVVHSARKEEWSHVFAYAMVHVGLIVSSILSFIGDTQVVVLSNVTRIIFMNSIAQFVWIILPVVLMIVLPERVRRESDSS